MPQEEYKTFLAKKGQLNIQEIFMLKAILQLPGLKAPAKIHTSKSIHTKNHFHTEI